MKLDAVINTIKDEIDMGHDGYVVIRLKRKLRPLLAGSRTPNSKLIDQRNQAIAKARSLRKQLRFFKKTSLRLFRELNEYKLSHP